jgi:uroporphyrinogen-III decarboxylase
VIDQNAVFDGSTLKIIRDPIMIDSKFDNNIDNQIFLDESIKSINGTTIKILDHNLIFDANSIKLIDSNATSIDKINSSALKVPMERKIRNSVKRKRDLSSITNLNSIETRKSKIKTMKKYPNTSENVDESNTSLSFIRWLVIRTLVLFYK